MLKCDELRHTLYSFLPLFKTFASESGWLYDYATKILPQQEIQDFVTLVKEIEKKCVR
jgi:hypothetical protein